MGTLFIGLSALVAVLIVFVNIADYSIYTYKRNELSGAMDYAVTAASQQISYINSMEGVSDGFSPDTGQKLLENVKIDMGTAETAFLEVFKKNYSAPDKDITDNLLLCSTYTDSAGRIHYDIKAGQNLAFSGTVEDTLLLEDRVNNALKAYWPENTTASIYVNGNSKTNQLEKGTYLLAVINDIEISGVLSKRKISLSSFTGAKVERLTVN